MARTKKVIVEKPYSKLVHRVDITKDLYQLTGSHALHRQMAEQIGVMVEIKLIIVGFNRVYLPLIS